MDKKTYFFRPVQKGLKQNYVLEDESKQPVCEATVLKQALLGPMTYEFTNHAGGKSETHRIGHTVTTEQTGLLGAFSAKSRFKYDGENIWDYLHGQGIRIQTQLAGNRLGMCYDVTWKGRELARLATAPANGGSGFLTSATHFTLCCAEEDLDLAFLTAFAIARTEQLSYD